MTNEEAREQIENLRAHCSDMARSTFTGGEVLWSKDVEALDQAIKALAQEPCEDAISRKAVLDSLVEYMDAFYNENGRMMYSDHIITNADCNDLKEWIRSFPSVNPQEPKWIPVSERLPKDRREVLVTAYWHETYQVMMASYFGDGLWWCVPFNNCGEHTQRLKPKAWMPLPEPYKVESEV